MKSISKILMAITCVSAVWISGVQAKEVSPRIISADAGVTALLRAFGMEQQLVGIDVTSTQPTQGAALPVVGYHRQLAAEGLLALHPTVLIGGEHMGPDATLSAVEAADVHVVRLPHANNAQELLVVIRQLADAVGKPAQAQQVLQQVQEKVNTLQADSLPKNTTALFLLSAGTRGLRAAGVGTGGDALIHLLGAKNVMTYNNYQPISTEAIMATNPDVILLAADDNKNARESFLQDYPALSVLKAIKNNHLLTVRSETLVAGLSVLTVDEALRLQKLLANAPALVSAEQHKQ